MQSGQWQFWVDRGGTFTDIVAKTPDNQFKTHKLLSENPEQYKDAAIAGIRYFLQLEEDEPIPTERIYAIKMGTTVATNALLERKGEKTALLITAGLKDALRIGYQTRPDIFAINIQRPTMLFSEVIEVEERIGADGSVIITLNEAKVREALAELKRKGFQSIAVVLMHGYQYVQHEQKIARIAEELGFPQVSVSHRVSPLQKLISRGDTTVVDAYLSPVLRKYVQQVQGELNRIHSTPTGEPAEGKTSRVPLYFMQSNGGLTRAEKFEGKDAILSGPAGGVVGMVKTALPAGCDKIVGFDMGGTSTDVSHYAGEYERVFETEVAGVRLRAPMMQIHTVAAGGGSILQYRDGRYQVGPESAGANPGPACYRRGGPLTVTDCNVMLGKIQPNYFPAIFGEKADLPLDHAAVVEAFEVLAQTISDACGAKPASLYSVAEGFLHVAVENMANAIKSISIQRGYDLQHYTLVSFGGAGAQHACLVAERLNIKKVLLHPFSGVLSAFGIGLADQIKLHDESINQPLSSETLSEVANRLIPIQDRLVQQLGSEHSLCDVTIRLHMKYQNSDTALLVDILDAIKEASPDHQIAQLANQFAHKHRQLFGFVSNQPLVVEALQVQVTLRSDQHLVSFNAPRHAGKAIDTCEFFSRGKHYFADIYRRESLAIGQVIEGPAIILEAASTIVIEPHWQAIMTEQGNIEMSFIEDAMQQPISISETSDIDKPDPVMLEIFNNRFMNAAEQMGYVLERTASSVNIKERLDFSCAVFSKQGELIANAPHIPVHLGSMSESVTAVMKEYGSALKKGDAFAVNTPYNGGTHLPDVTIVKPVFCENNHLIFFVAARGHHADIGGITPGSMPPFSRHINEEGILLENVKLVSEGEFQESLIRNVLTNHDHPVRNLEQNIADLKAQIASCEKGAAELLAMNHQYGHSTVQSYVAHALDNAEFAVRQVIMNLSDGHYRYEMDDGSIIEVGITIHRKSGSATVNFSGTSPQHTGNFNAPSSVAKAAVLYTFRCLIEHNIPLNAGIFRALEIKIPSGCMLNPQYPAAVVSGNVETAQYIVDTLMLALGVMASCQGTNNNFTFGNDQYQYYETLCGGIGASDRNDGASAVHAHMTNSRLTDPEVLESRYPVRLERFELRTHSGGKGRYVGGEGMHRAIRFLQPMTAAMISGHRIVPPAGLEGGEAGACGINQVIRRDGTQEPLGALAQIDMNENDVFDIRTPGGGGFGKQP